MIALALKALGLMRVSEHERIKNAEILRYTRLNDSLRNERNDAQDKFKLAATDLAAQAEEIASQSVRIAELNAEIFALNRDAQKWRDYLKRSRDRKAGKK